MSEPAIQQALTAEEIFLKRDKERYLYEMREKALLDHLSAMAGAEEKGRIEGIAEGAKQNSLEVAKKALQEGVDIALIAKLTGLTKSEIEKLAEELAASRS